MPRKKKEWQLVEFPQTDIDLEELNRRTLVALKSLTDKMERDGLLKFDHYVFHDRLASLVTYVRNQMLACTECFALRVKPYLYGTRRDMHDPECKISVKADIFYTHSHWVPTIPQGPASGEGHAGTETAHRCKVNLETGEIVQKDDTPLKLHNAKEVIALIREIVGEQI